MTLSPVSSRHDHFTIPRPASSRHDILFLTSRSEEQCRGTEMKALSFITEREPIRMIIAYLKETGIDVRAGPFAYCAAKGPVLPS